MTRRLLRYFIFPDPPSITALSNGSIEPRPSTSSIIPLYGLAMRPGAYVGRVLRFGNAAARRCDTAGVAGEAEKYSEEYT
jgi:hypothetical protein